MHGLVFGWLRAPKANSAADSIGDAINVQSLSCQFLEAFPHHGLDERLAKIAEERDASAADLDRRLHRRDFDLSRVGDEQKISRDDTSRRPTNSVSCARSSVFWRRPRDLQRNGKTNLNVDGIADGEGLQSSLSLGLFIHRVESRLLFIVE
jgi:hypothetical protein